MARSRSLNVALAREQVVEQEHHDRTCDRDAHAIEVQPAHAFLAEEAEQIAADNCADDPKADVQPEALALPVDDFASDEACDESKYDPAQNAHLRISSLVRCPFLIPDIPGFRGSLI